MNSNRQDYLLAVYRLSGEEGFTSNKSIAEYFEISKASVSEMVKKLQADGLLIVEGTKIRLSKEGLREAEALLTTHRLWEYFLMKVLDFPKDQVHEQADLLEHVTGEALKEALNRYLGYPKNCPHGQSIFENLDRK